MGLPSTDEGKGLLPLIRWEQLEPYLRRFYFPEREEADRAAETAEATVESEIEMEEATNEADN